MRKTLLIILAVVILFQGLFCLNALAADTAYISIYSRVDNTYILEKNEFEIDENATVYTLLKQCGVQFKHKNGYVEQLAGLREKQHGPDSGWVFTVDGQRVSVGAIVCKLKGGEYVEWIYITGDSEEISSFTTTSQIVTKSENTTEQPPVSTQPSETRSEELMQPPVVQSIMPIDEPTSVPPMSVVSAIETSVQETTSIGAQITSQNNMISSNYYEYAVVAAAYLTKNPGHWSAIPIYRAGLGVDNSALVFEEKGEKLNEIIRGLIVKSELYNLSHDEQNSMMQSIMNHPDLYMATDNILIFALMAAGVSNSTQYYDELSGALLARQNADGGFTLKAGEASDIDITAMALRAMHATGMTSAGVQESARHATDWLIMQMNENGSFGNPANCESTAQALMALSAQKNCSDDLLKQIANALMTFKSSDAQASFSHLLNGESDVIATEQAVQALFEYCDLRLEQPYNRMKIEPMKNHIIITVICISATLLAAAVITVLKIKSDKKKGDKHRAE